MRTIGIIFSIIFILLFVTTCSYVSFFWTQANRVIEKTFDADNVIYNYEWFKRQYQDINAMDIKILNIRAQALDFTTNNPDRASWTFEDKQEDSRLRSITLGLQNQRLSMVAEYNAKANMANRDIFRTSELPAQLNP